MTMTNLGVTKEEMIYQFVISLNKGGYASGVYAGEVVAKAIGEYDALVNKGIIKEEDPNEELRKGLNRVRRQAIMDKAYDMSVDGFNELMAYLEPIPTGEYRPISPESDVMYMYDEINHSHPNTLNAEEGKPAFDDFGIKVNMYDRAGNVIKSNTFPTEEVNM